MADLRADVRALRKKRTFHMMSVKCPGGLGAGPQRGLGQRPRGPNKYIIIIPLYIHYITDGSLFVRSSVTQKINFSY